MIIGAKHSLRSPQLDARIGGVLYLVIIAVGASSELFIRSTLVVPGNPTATAERILASEQLWRFGIAAELFLLLSSAVVLALILYRLLRPVSRDLALLAVLFNLVSISVEAANKLYLVTALFPLGTARYLSAFTPEQLHALASLAIRSYAHGFGISLIFFGWECIILGYLIYRSGYLPRIIGVLMAIAGSCYLANSFTLIAFPSLSNRIFLVIMLPVLVAEMSLALWLLVKGVNVPKWSERTGQASQ